MIYKIKRPKEVNGIVALKSSAKFTGKHLQCSPIFSKFTKYKTPMLVFSCIFCETFTTAFLKNTSGRRLKYHQMKIR